MNFEEINGIQTGSGLKIVLYGQEGVGKSTLASKFPGAVFIDCEGSTTRMNVRRLPKPTSWEMLKAEMEYILESCKVKGYQTVIIDTFDWAERLALEALCAEHKVSGIEGMNYGKGWEYEKEMIGRFLDRTDRLIAAGVNVVLLCHAITKKTTGTTTLTADAKLRSYSVIPNTEGDNINIYTYSGNLKARGELSDVTVSSSDDWQTVTIST